MRDKAEKGRAQPGDSHPLAKLTEAAVLAIRSDKRTQTAIAADYGVDSSTISLIKNRKRWAHI
jgi:DNA invertase Pin-like site-specific DNA recombinase